MILTASSTPCALDIECVNARYVMLRVSACAPGPDPVATVLVPGIGNGDCAADDDAVKDSSKNLQVLWSRATLAKNGELDDPVALKLLPKSTRGVVEAGSASA